MISSLDLELFTRIGAAAGLGALVGLERETHGQAAGLRTNMIVATGSALIMVVSMHMTKEKGDPGRIAAQNCLRKRASFSKSHRMSAMPYLHMAMRSMPRPKAYPL